MPITATDLLTSLVNVNSVNPSLDSGARGEAALADRIAAFCLDRGIATYFQDVEQDRRNVLAMVPGREPAERLLFVAHMDTVPALGWQRDPFHAECRDGCLYGRGAADTKASLAAMLLALESVCRERPRATIIVAGSVDEEYLKKGAKVLARTEPGFVGAVVGEPTALEPVIAHKGSARWSIEVQGRPAHSAMPELGRNAIVDMAAVVTALHAHGEDLGRRQHPLVGAPSLTVSLIEGGSDICTVPAHCRIGIDRRLVPGESLASALQEVDAILTRLQAEHPGLIARTLSAVGDPAFEGAAEGRLAQVTRAACGRHARTGGDFKGVPYGTDASQLGAAGIPCIVLGPGNIAQAHAVDEYVEISQLETAVRIYRSIMLDY